MQVQENFSMIGTTAERPGTESVVEMVCLTDLKNKLYDLLLTPSEETNNNLKLDQKLGVSISKSVQKEGNVQIFQLQSANVQHITEKVVDALKMVDALEAGASARPLEMSSTNLKLISEKPVKSDISKDLLLLTKVEAETPQELTDTQRDDKIERDFMAMMYRHKLNWKDMQQFVLSTYFNHVLASSGGNRGEVSKFLDIQRAYVSKKVGEFKSEEKQ